MSNEVILAILTILGSVLGSVFGVWALTRKNKSEVEKEQGLGQVRAQDAEIKERADLISMIKEHTKQDAEHTKQGAIWLEALKIIESTREKDYATLKAIIEDGTQETINSRKELLKNVDGVAVQAREHNTGITNSLDEVKRELGSLRTVVEKLPGQNDEMKSRIDITLGYIERLLPKLRSTSELPVTTVPNGSLPEPTPSIS